MEDNDWVDAVVWDDTDPLPKPPAFHLDDPHVVVLQHEVDEFIGNLKLMQVVALRRKGYHYSKRGQTERLSIDLMFLMIGSTSMLNIALQGLGKPMALPLWYILYLP